ncbi:MAG: hypothetical protein MJE77_24205 [Proteobacteria bacterium]|nr:hypothetical protein [Pseudomonadota bacterium]
MDAWHLPHSRHALTMGSCAAGMVVSGVVLRLAAQPRWADATNHRY